MVEHRYMYIDIGCGCEETFLQVCTRAIAIAPHAPRAHRWWFPISGRSGCRAPLSKTHSDIHSVQRLQSALFRNTTSKRIDRMSTTLSHKFRTKKQNILTKLDHGKDGVPDASPKGNVDEGVRELIDTINTSDGCVTTSSCAGRVAVFVGGKGPGGNWLYTSHEPIDPSCLTDQSSAYELVGLCREATFSSPPRDNADVRTVHLKFEPLVGGSLSL